MGVVTEESVGRTLSVTASMERPSQLIASNMLTGVVTEVRPAGTYHVGDVVLAVAGTPVFVVEADEPFYRDLAVGTVGDDVRALQQALVTLGHLRAEPDGIFGGMTARAVRSWHVSVGLGPTETVPLGTVVGVPTLPTALVVDDAIVPGAVMSGGEPAVHAATGDPIMTLVLSTAQAQMIPPGAEVDVSSGQATWTVTAGEVTRNESGNSVVSLVTADGGPACGQACHELPAEQSFELPAVVHIVPARTGPAVPAAAVRTQADGSTYTLLESGERRTVEIVATGGGLSVVEGLSVGERYVILDAVVGES